MIISKDYLKTLHKPKCFGWNPNDTCLCILKDLCEKKLSIESDRMEKKIK